MAFSLPRQNQTGANEYTDVQVNDQYVLDAVEDEANSYRTILQSSGFIEGNKAAATYLLSPNVNALASGQIMFSGTSSPTRFLPLIHWDDADYATHAALAVRLRVRAQVATNGTAPTATYAVGLYPVTFSGAAADLIATAGTVVSGSAASIAAPAANSVTQTNSGDFIVPVDGAYCLAVATTGTTAVNASTQVSAQLQVRNV